MEMEMGMDSLSFYQHLPMNFPPSPCSASGQEALSYYYNPPFPAAITNKRDDVDPTPPSPPPPPRQKAAVVARRGRNSKICTAGGMRDRRMRLSLHVARRFFALQDKLGFDKASKTVQWLLDMSTAGVNHLPTSSMSLSEEDATSGSVLLENNDHFMVTGAISAERNNCKQQMPKARKGAPVLQDKESRTRARERARERTKERKRLRTSVSIAEEALAPARQVIPVPAAACSSSFEHGSGSYYDEQEAWELGGVVFANSRFH